MRQRDRKKVIDRQSLFNIHLARFTAELNQTVEEAYRALDEFIASASTRNEGTSQPVLATKPPFAEAIRKGPRTAD